MRAVASNDVRRVVWPGFSDAQSETKPGLLAASAVVQGSGCGSSSSSGSQLVWAHGSVGFHFLGGVLQDSSSDDEAARPKPAKVRRGKTVAVPVGIVCESESDSDQ